MLNDWKKGETIELEVDYRITDDIFDGEGVYNEGRYHQIIYVDVE